MANIKRVSAIQILDSRGNPTIEVEIELTDGITARSSAPSGASKGTFEAHELRDSQAPDSTVENAINLVNGQISQAIIGLDSTHQQEIDKVMMELDGTENKARLGANSMIAVSQSVAKAAAKSTLTPLRLYLRKFLANVSAETRIPTPIFNMLEGGKHSSNGLNFQEYLVIPAASKQYGEQLNLGRKVYFAVKELLKERSLSLEVADEGGFAPNVLNNKEALFMLKSAIDKAGFSFALDAFLGVDVAANGFYNNKQYLLIDRALPYSKIELSEFYEEIFNDYSLLYLEDPFAEEDKEGWQELAAKLLSKTMIVGDDLTTTNPYRLQQAVDNNLINSVIVKPNQIGTVSEALVVCEMAKFKNLKIIVSHRSGETMDDFIADFAVGVGADYVKFGAPARERVVKYNRLLQIQKELKSQI